MQLKCLFFSVIVLLSFLCSSFAQEPMLLEHGGGVRTVVFSPVDASLVASAGESNIIKLWNLQNDTVIDLIGHTSRVNSVAFSPNGQLLASVSDDRTIKLWNVNNQQNIATLQEGTLFRTVAFSPNGQLLATGGSRHVKLWNARNQTEIATLQHNQDVWTAAFSRDGQLLAVGDSSRDGSGSVKIWNVRNQQVTATLKDDMVVVRSVTFSPDDRYLASSHYNGEVKVWNVSDWQLLRTIPQAGDYDIAFSPDGKMIVGTGNENVNLWWIEDGTNVANLVGPAGWMHPVDFSHDGGLLAVGAEDGIIRIWRIDTSPGDEREAGAVQILHIDIYLQQLPRANSANGDNIPDPIPPPAVVRDFFELDPYYEQWINVGGLPVLASAKVNPYALKETAWIILKMIEHRPQVLRPMIEKKVRFGVIGHTELLGDIPAYNHLRDDFPGYRVRGSGGSGVPEILGRPTTTTSEESILAYRGENNRLTNSSDNVIVYNALIHEFAHAIHLFGLKSTDPAFDNRLRIAYERAIKKGLWQDTYASSDMREYWAEASMAWLYPKGAGSFDRFGNTRQALKAYDPELAILLTEVYGDTQWRYTLPETRTHLPHLQGFNLQDTPIYEGFPELKALHEKFLDPNSDAGDDWVDLKPYDPNELANLKKSTTPGLDRTVVYFFNLTQADIFVYTLNADGAEYLWTRVPPGFIRGWDVGRGSDLYVIKDTDGRNLVVFQAEEKLGRALIGTPPDKTDHEPSLDPIQSVDVNSDGLVNVLDLVLVSINFGKTGQNIADVNGDGVVNIVDLVKVAGEIAGGAAAPSAHPQLLEMLTATDVRQWLTQAQDLDLTDATSQRGILMLQQLLAALIPKDTSLLPNYPNPFNPETWIPYQLAEDAEVTLTIYTADGKVVRTLALGQQPAGIYRNKTRAAYWDGRNQVGEPVASGVYFYTLTTDDFTATRKMLIRK